MEDYEEYDLREDDPYTQENGCLINLLGYRNTRDLNLAEAELADLRIAELRTNPIPPTWDLDHFKRIHHYIFQDIYPFAGQIRQVEISKGGKLFLPHSLIEATMAEIFSELAADNHLNGLFSTHEFCSRAGYFLGRINLCHPFREGNGRAQRLFIDQLALQNDLAIQWAGISGEAMAKACREAREENGSSLFLERLLINNICTSKPSLDYSSNHQLDGWEPTGG